MLGVDMNPNSAGMELAYYTTRSAVTFSLPRTDATIFRHNARRTIVNLTLLRSVVNDWTLRISLSVMILALSFSVELCRHWSCLVRYVTGLWCWVFDSGN
jgi:hypothetical protein